jgi:hypothetical protein
MIININKLMNIKEMKFDLTDGMKLHQDIVELINDLLKIRMVHLSWIQDLISLNKDQGS